MAKKDDKEKEVKMPAPKLTSDNKKKVKVPGNVMGSLTDGITFQLPDDITESSDEDIEAGLAMFGNDEVDTVDVVGLMKMSKDVIESVVTVDRTQIRHLLNRYIETQKRRKASQLQLMSLQPNNRTDYEKEIKVTNDNCALVWIFEQEYNTEQQIEKMLKEWVMNQPMGKYLTSIKGIGPIFAAKIIAYLSLDNTKHDSTYYPGTTVYNRSSFIQLCGLNDNNCPWLGTTKAVDVVSAAYDKFGLKKKDEPTEEVLIYLSNATGRRVDTLMKGATIKPSKKKAATEEDNANVGKITRDSLCAALAKPPYNMEMKTTCYLIGNSFMFNANRGSLYGQYYLQRKQKELEKNERGDYAETAAKLLASKNYKKGTPTYECLSNGKLTLGHITQRSKRWATKLFISHVFEAMYYERFGEMPPVPWVLEYTPHKDYYAPEVDFRKFFPSKEEYKRNLEA